MHFLRSLLVLSALAIAGCAAVRETPLTIAPLKHPQIDPVTQEIGIISDTQIHESRGTASRFFSKAGDEVVEVTIRTGQQVIGSTDILVESLQRLAAAPLIIHNGDAIDVSCQTEWDTFMRAMAVGRPDRAWVLVGGNHDGYFVGNATPTKDTRYNVGHWNQVCNQGRYPITDPTWARHFDKNALITENLRHIGRRHGRPADAPIPSIGSCLFDANAADCAAWHLDTHKPWHSYLVQVVRLPSAKAAMPPVYAVVMDSSTYDQHPQVALDSPVLAGTEAGFTVEQLVAVGAIIDKLPKDARFFLVTHHHVQQWYVDRMPKAQRDALTNIVQDARFLQFVLTGHTHEGGWYRHTILGHPVTELNTGSLADPPLYFRDLQFGVTEDKVTKDKRWWVLSERTVLTPQNVPGCGGYKLPDKDSGYSVDEQRSENDRLHEAPGFVRQIGRIGSAIYRFLTFWRAKHDELRPQLLAYREVVQAALPIDAKFTYMRWVDDEAPPAYTTRKALEDRLEHLANCHHAELCSVTEKGNLLKKLEDDLSVASKNYPPDVIAKAHQARLCAAVAATQESGKHDKVVAEVLEWSSPEEVMLPIPPARLAP